MSRKITLFVDGMVCNNCEKRIKSTLMKLKGIEKVKASFRKSTVEITYNENKINSQTVIRAIEKLGYGILERTKNPFTTVLPFLVLLFAGFYMIKNTIGFNFIPDISQEMGYGLIFLVGLLTSIHCIAMCGGIALSQSVSHQSQNRNILPSLLYNTGRIISYTIIGGIVGGLGSIISPTGQFKGAVAIGAGIFMFLLGFKMLNILTFPNWMKLKIPKLSLGKRSMSKPLSPLFIGLLNGFMPCGPLQTMQLYALGTGSVVKGALSMFYFSIGTVPLMLGFGFITSLISNRSGRRMIKTSAVLVMVLGLIMVNRGLALSGVAFDLGVPKDAITQTSDLRVEDGKQVINMVVNGRSYTPEIETVQVGVPVKINLDVLGINRCNNPLVIPEYGIEMDLMSEDTVIEFIPTKEGPIRISCWMGMITTKLVAVEDSSKVHAQ
ncbi:urease accessory protein UreH domain-containing protein [Anaeromicrobium sediminis]|uniref:HMA domain-containing protein n=1 Tax=Anaeromicrobium sediminis TaxID=1478221 RepID=A0A267MLE9_9FIRM|nr:sulfite exporter TauE/SafE family protein [Anaeromicrobium sediminis]PAB60232.1 hypothetical protein CCE28_04860 [Anaeromicrobium sediminis]